MLTRRGTLSVRRAKQSSETKTTIDLAAKRLLQFRVDRNALHQDAPRPAEKRRTGRNAGARSSGISGGQEKTTTEYQRTKVLAAVLALSCDGTMHMAGSVGYSCQNNENSLRIRVPRFQRTDPAFLISRKERKRRVRAQYISSLWRHRCAAAGESTTAAMRIQFTRRQGYPKGL
ncbi:hypothetical protein BD309DRAFT_588403 [Dichomitus squalens]|nr:hypothetical protein BD309DRAFT_588403 [Dichomitus squalens]